MEEQKDLALFEESNLPANTQPERNMLQNSDSLNRLYKLAKSYARSSMVPDVYRGNPDNCFVAVELAARMDVSPVLVMQNLYIVQGRPSWAGSACKALIDGCGKFSHSEFVMSGSIEDGTAACYLQAVNNSTGKLVKGTEITMRMAAAEGWLDKKGSKWKTMPEQMLKYRAASFFARSECPEALMGFQTAEEVQDTKGWEQQEPPRTISISLNDAEVTTEDAE